MKQIKLMQGDNILSLKKLPDNSIDSVVTDAPYGLGKEQDMNIVLKDWIEKGYSEIKGKGFMGKEWDAYVPQPAFWKEVFRVLKPGGHVLCFFGTRTYDIGTMAMRLAGFEIRDQIMWIYGSGFPKSLNIGKAFDKKEGNEREVVGDRPLIGTAIHEGGTRPEGKEKLDITKGNSQYEGWGTALKPANEPICLARKPLSEKTIVDNVIKWGTGGINIDGCRIEGLYGSGENEIIEGKEASIMDKYDNTRKSGAGMKQKIMVSNDSGRFPANILFDETAAEMLDEQSGISQSKKRINPSTFIPPVPHLITLSTIVFSLKGFLAKQIGSFAGFSAVPQPSYCDEPFVFIFCVLSLISSPLPLYPVILPFGLLSLHSFPSGVIFSPTTSLSLPFFLSNALPIFKLFGKPEPYIHIIWSLISKPASSIFTTIL